jgi:hypothetical protein
MSFYACSTSTINPELVGTYVEHFKADGIAGITNNFRTKDFEPSEKSPFDRKTRACVAFVVFEEFRNRVFLGGKQNKFS